MWKKYNWYCFSNFKANKTIINPITTVWSFIFGDLRNVEQTIIAITPRSTQTQSSHISLGLYMGQIDLFKNYSYLMGIPDGI